MKLLSKPEVKNSIAKENEELVDRNIRLRKMEREGLARLNSAKADYTPEKLKATNEFEKFVDEILKKKSQLLEELSQIEQEIDDKKDIYYGLVVKQDELEEREHRVSERESKVLLREQFVSQVESRLSKIA